MFLRKFTMNMKAVTFGDKLLLIFNVRGLRTLTFIFLCEVVTYPKVYSQEAMKVALFVKKEIVLASVIRIQDEIILNYNEKCWSLSRVRLFVTPWIVARQAPLSIGFFRQEYWNEHPFSSPRDLPNPGIKPGSLAFPADFYLLSHQRSPS